MTNINFTNIQEDVLWKIIRINVKAVNVKANELRESDEKAKLTANLIINKYHKTMLFIWNTDFRHTQYTSYSHQMLKQTSVYSGANRELSFNDTGDLTEYAWVGDLMKKHLGRVINLLETTWNALNNFEQWYAEYNGKKETEDGI